jgi:SAM-dependent methyltransferase
MIWVGLACLAVFLWADTIIEILYSSNFNPTASPLRWLLPGIFALSVGRVLVAELLAREKPHYLVWASGAATVINIIGNILLVPHMGITGSAIASSVSGTLLALSLIRFYLRETGLPFSVLLPRHSDLAIYASVGSIVANYWPSKGTERKSSAAEVQTVRALPAASIPGERRNELNLVGADTGRDIRSILLRKMTDFYVHPHFPFFLLVPIRKISPTLARYLRYGRYNPNTEAYWNERYRSGSYQTEEDPRYQTIDQEIIKLIAPGSRILDAGCGTGRVMEKLRDQRNCSCVGVDISGVAVRNVRAKGFRAFKCELPDLASDLSRERFDVCTVLETLEHVSNPHSVLESLLRVLKNGASIIVSVPDDCMKPHEFDEHVSSFDRQSLCELLGQYCKVDRILCIEAGGYNHLIARGKVTRFSRIESAASKSAIGAELSGGN